MPLQPQDDPMKAIGETLGVSISVDVIALAGLVGGVIYSWKPKKPTG
jgi:hypothetical protein